MVLTLADMDGQETFEASALGTAAEVTHVAMLQISFVSSLGQSIVPASRELLRRCSRLKGSACRWWRSLWRTMTWS